MTPKEKAKFLFDKYDDYPLTHWWKKQCALIAVEELIKEEILWLEEIGGGEEQYWEQVKQELENL